MAIQTKTVVEFVTAWEGGHFLIEAALKKPGADRIIMAIRRWDDGNMHQEVWDVG